MHCAGAVNVAVVPVDSGRKGMGRNDMHCAGGRKDGAE